jgi:methylmalonyl-CoA/ethylmalonyl-CoA epimerase
MAFPQLAGGTRFMLGRFSHIGVLVRDLPVAVERFCSVLGAQVVDTGYIPETRTDVTVLDLGGIQIELLSSREPDTKVGRLLCEHGEGIHHLSFEVSGISERLADLRSYGIKLLDEVPRRGLHDRQIAFLAPQDTSGILIELVEENSKEHD